MRVSPETPQETLNKEIANIFALVQCAIKQPQSQEDANRILAETKDLVEHYGVSSDHIKQRELNTLVDVRVAGKPDDIYPSIVLRPLQQPHGLPLNQRMDKFREVGRNLLENHYADCQTLYLACLRQ